MIVYSFWSRSVSKSGREITKKCVCRLPGELGTAQGSRRKHSGPFFCAEVSGIRSQLARLNENTASHAWPKMLPTPAAEFCYSRSVIMHADDSGDPDSFPLDTRSVIFWRRRSRVPAPRGADSEWESSCSCAISARSAPVNLNLQPGLFLMEAVSRHVWLFLRLLLQHLLYLSAHDFFTHSGVCGGRRRCKSLTSSQPFRIEEKQAYLMINESVVLKIHRRL